jgi:hypothetical protein
MGYRNDKTLGVATGQTEQTMYMVTRGDHVNGGCCFDCAPMRPPETYHTSARAAACASAAAHECMRRAFDARSRQMVTRRPTTTTTVRARWRRSILARAAVGDTDKATGHG